jgi:hypothetical protein
LEFQKETSKQTIFGTREYGHAQVTLKHGQTITINDLPDAYAYEIVEADAEGYTAEIKLNNEEDWQTANDMYGYAVNQKETKVEYKNTKQPKEPRTLTLGKQVVSEKAADKAEDFTFDIYLLKYTQEDPDSATYNATYNNSGSYEAVDGVFTVTSGTIEGSGANTPDYFALEFKKETSTQSIFGEREYGHAQVQLKHGQTITINDLPDGYAYEIVEANADGYTTKVAVNGNNKGEGVDMRGYALNQKELDVEYTNTSERGNSKLTLSKKVEGNAADTNEDFVFDIYLLKKAASGSGYTTLLGTFPVTAGADSDAEAPNYTKLTFEAVSTQTSLISGQTYKYGHAQVTLKHGQTITISDLPDNYAYEIVETPVSGYTATATVESADGQTKTWSDNVIPGIVSSVGETKVQFLNKKEEASLTLGKIVNGTMAASYKAKAYKFTIKLTDSNAAPINKTFPVTAGTNAGVTGATAPDISSLSFDENGEATVSLKHGQTITIKGLPVDYRYSIKEAVEEGDSKYCTTTIAGPGTVDNAAREISELNYNSNNAITITYTNRFDVITPAGVNMNIAPFAILFALVFGFGFAFLVSRKRRCR